jgi:hypothetical protein
MFSPPLLQLIDMFQAKNSLRMKEKWAVTGQAKQIAFAQNVS